MNNQLPPAFGPTPANPIGLRQQYRSVLLMALLVVLGACNASRTESTKGQRMRLTVGDIKEVTIPARPDSTNQLTATSDNQEVVDVSRKPSEATAPNGPQLSTTGPTVFLIKGVTAGTAKVVFSEKPVGAEGSGRVRKAYVVTVVSK